MVAISPTWTEFPLMKKSIPFTFMLLAFLMACKDPTENVYLHVSPDFYDYAVYLSVRDIADPSQPLSQNASFELIGNNVQDVYMIDGSRNYRLTNGEAGLILDRTTIAPSKEQPIEFKIRISSNGYEPRTHRIEIVEEEFYSEEVIYLIPRNANVSGSGNSNTSVGLNGGNAIIRPLEIQFATTSDTLPSDFNLILDSATVLLDRDGNLISGAALRADISGYDTYSDNSTLSMPGSSLFQDVEINGQRTQTIIGPMPRLDINMRVGQTEVKSFQNGSLKYRMSIPEVTNPTTLRTYKAGDSVIIWSYDDVDGFWKIAGGSKVEEDIDGKYIWGEVDNLSAKSFAPPINGEIPVFMEIDLNGQIMLYNDLRIEYPGFSKLANRSANSQFNVNLLPALVLFAVTNPDYVFLEVETGNGRYSSKSSTPSDKRISVAWNATNDTVRYTLPNSSNVFEGHYRAFCENQPNVLLYPPVGARIYVKESIALDYPQAPAHIVTRENKNDLTFRTSTVVDGGSYDIKLTYGGESVAERFGIIANSGDTIEVVIPAADCDLIP